MATIGQYRPYSAHAFYTVYMRSTRRLAFTLDKEKHLQVTDVVSDVNPGLNYPGYSWAGYQFSFSCILSYQNDNVSLFWGQPKS